MLFTLTGTFKVIGVGTCIVRLISLTHVISDSSNRSLKQRPIGECRNVSNVSLLCKEVGGDTQDTWHVAECLLNLINTTSTVHADNLESRLRDGHLIPSLLYACHNFLNTNLAFGPQRHLFLDQFHRRLNHPFDIGQ